MSAKVTQMTPPTLQRVGVGAERHQQSDSTVGQDVALLSGLPKDQQELAVTGMLDQSKQWLDRAMAATNPAHEVSEFRAFIATVAEAAKQKKLSEGIRLDSTEMVRRAERALGVAIREGQDAGEISSRATRENQGNQYKSGQSAIPTLSKPTDFATHSELNGNPNGSIYALTDDVTDAEFETALATARDEGNLSRSNVGRNIKRAKAEGTGLSREAHTSDMLAWHQELAEKYPLPRIAFEAVGHERHASLEAFVSAARKTYQVKYRFTEQQYAKHAAQSQDWLERSSMSIDVALDVLSHIDFTTITPEQAEEALQRLDVTRQLNLYIRELKGITNE